MAGAADMDAARDEETRHQTAMGGMMDMMDSEVGGMMDMADMHMCEGHEHG